MLTRLNSRENLLKYRVSIISLSNNLEYINITTRLGLEYRYVFNRSI